MTDILKKGKTVKISKDRQSFLKDMLGSWALIHTQINDLTKEELWKTAYLEFQANGSSRVRVIKRILARAGTVQRAEDMAALGL